MGRNPGLLRQVNPDEVSSGTGGCWANPYLNSSSAVETGSPMTEGSCQGLTLAMLHSLVHVADPKSWLEPFTNPEVDPTTALTVETQVNSDGS